MTTTVRDPRTARALLIAFAAVSVVHLLAILVHLTLLQNLTKPLLMPLLAAWVWAGAAAAPRLLIPALLFGAGGDILLQFGTTPAFLAGMGSFALGHLCYVTMFVRLGAFADRRRALLTAAGYAVAWGVLISQLWPDLGDLQIAVAGYSLLLTATAVSSAGINGRAGLGGALFLLSDTLIATDLAHWKHLPGHGFLVMATYLAGQYLLTTGTLARTAAATAPAGAAVATA
ncbi:lysoplasmalogenase [Kitasatospora sp. NPDC049285]|uniref:lysoplasmalogenase n=1 Tax=Kitasatospora sp. NPDC049285 TaxID=3157096 RepID=UPI00341A1CC8